MNINDWPYELDTLFESLLPDFVLAFAFFTSVVYAVLAKRLERQRAAVGASASIGLALSVGLVWWEQANNLSVRNLGPLAVGFAILLLAFVMYASIKSIGGTWAGAGITLGACIIVAKILGLGIPIDQQVIQSVTTAALVMGIFAFLMHTRRHGASNPIVSRFKVPDVRPNMTRLFRDRHLSNDLSRKMKKVRKEAASLDEHPEEAGDVLLQIRRMLPAQGYLTERMAQLRAKTHQVRNGHIARLEETKAAFASLPASAKKRASAELAARYNQLVGIDTRLERLDRAVAENERRIKDLTEQAQAYTARHEQKKLYEALKTAERLQKHNSHLFKIIERTEEKLSAVARQIAKEVRQNEKAEEELSELDPAYETIEELKIGRVLDRYGISFFYKQPTVILNPNTEKNEIWKPSFTLPQYGCSVIDYIAQAAGQGSQDDPIQKRKDTYDYNHIPATVLGPKDLDQPHFPDDLYQKLKEEFRRFHHPIDYER